MGRIVRLVGLINNRICNHINLAGDALGTYLLIYSNSTNGSGDELPDRVGRLQSRALRIAIMEQRSIYGWHLIGISVCRLADLPRSIHKDRSPGTQATEQYL
jgi:hypothetical protein